MMAANAVESIAGGSARDQGEDLRNDAGCPFIFVCTHVDFDVAALGRAIRIQGPQRRVHHQPGTRHGWAGVSGQPHRIGKFVADASALRRTKQLGQTIMNGDGRRLGEVIGHAHGSSLRQASDAEVDDHAVLVTLPVGNRQLPAKTLAQLLQQRNRVVVVDESHGLAVVQRAKCTEDRRMPEAAGNAARVKDMDIGFGYALE